MGKYIHEIEITTGMNVLFTDRNGNKEKRQVIHVWERPPMTGYKLNDELPLVNLDGDDDATSVPHLDSVKGASRFYYTVEV